MPTSDHVEIRYPIKTIGSIDELKAFAKQAGVTLYRRPSTGFTRINGLMAFLHVYENFNEKSMSDKEWYQFPFDTYYIITTDVINNLVKRIVVLETPKVRPEHPM